MGGSPYLIGSLAVWQGLFSASELDALVRLGDAARSPISLRDTNVTVMGMAGYRF